MKWRPSSSVTLPASGYIEPCIPTATKKAPAGSDWLFELKHDGYRLLARKDGREVRVYSRRGADFTARFPRLVDAMKQLRATSAMLDGEGIVYDDLGMPNFDYIHSRQYDREVSLVSFDLIELNREDTRSVPLIRRKDWLEKLVAKVRDGIEINDHLEGDGADIFKAACKLRHEGIVAKRKAWLTNPAGQRGG